MKFKKCNSRKWGNRQTFISKGFGLLSIGIFGFIIHVIYDAGQYQSHAKRVMQSGFSATLAYFPFEIQQFS